MVVSATGYTTNTSTRTLSCNGTTTIGLGSPPAGTICCDTCPVPNTLTLTDLNTTLTLTFSAGAGAWLGNYTLAGQSVRTLTAAGGGNCNCASGTSSILICYIFFCSGGSTKMRLTRQWAVTTRPNGALCAPVAGGALTLLDSASVTGGCSWAFVCSDAGATDPGVDNVSSSQKLPTACTPFSWTDSVTGDSTDPAAGTVSISA